MSKFKPITPNKKAVSASGMDQVRATHKRPWLLLAAGLALFLITIWIWRSSETSTEILTVEKSNLRIAEVTTGTFENSLPIRGVVTPGRVVAIDADNGGKVNVVHIRNGQSVKAGDLIVSLINPTLESQVVGREAEIMGKIEDAAARKLQIVRNSSAAEQAILQLKSDIRNLQNKIEARAPLVPEIVRKEELDTLRSDLELKQELLDFRETVQEEEAGLAEKQISSLDSSISLLRKNLTILKTQLKQLDIQSPISGVVGQFDLNPGQALKAGDKIGEINDVTQIKINATVDEFYLNRLLVGQTGSVIFNSNSYNVTLSKILPEIIGGEFEVEFVFLDKEPAQLRNGQNVEIKLKLDDDAFSTLLPVGSYLQITGGNWVFVLNSTGNKVTRRKIESGRRNQEYIEVLQGLSVGEKVITSDYASFLDFETLRID